MKISQVIEDLLRVQEEHGDLEVNAYSYGDIVAMPVAETAVHKSTTGLAYVLIEP